MATYGPPATVGRPDLFPQSFDQVAVLKTLRPGQLWSDPDFPPNDASLYGKGKQRPPAMPKVEAWLRPDEFSPLAAGETHWLIAGDAAAGDVVQGALGDCYLLGALSTVAASRYKGKSRLLNNIMPADGKSFENPCEGREKGLFTFRFYIFGDWVPVTVDTLIPCGADRRPVYARCLEASELWVLYIEKAYAKLHRSYQAMEGGSLTSALVDLTGGFAEEIDLRSEKALEELGSGQLWRRLMRYQKLGYLLGAAVTVPGGETQELTEHKLMKNHAYGVLLHYEQALSATPGEPLCLVKVRNPWGRGEWDGPWADSSAEWKTAAGEYASEQLDYAFADDGTFWMELGDYAGSMTSLYVCKVLAEDEWHRSVVSDAWSLKKGTAGGCFNFPSWRSNPQWQLQVAEASHAHLVMLQPDPRVQSGSREVHHTIGLYLMRGHEQFLRRVLVDSDELQGEEVVDSTDFSLSREVSCNTLDEEGELPLAPGMPYVLVPSSFLPGADGAFKVVIYTHRKPSVLAPVPPLLCATATGQWEGPTAGGPHGSPGWRRNPQFFVHARAGRLTRISLVLHRDDTGLASDLRAGAKGVRRKGLATGKAPGPILRAAVDAMQLALAAGRSLSEAQAAGVAAARELGASEQQIAAYADSLKRPLASEIGFVVAHAEQAQGPLAEMRALHVRKRDVVDRAEYERATEVACEFVLSEAGSFVVVPSTAQAGQAGGFTLSVYSDEPVELCPVREWLSCEAEAEWKGRSAAGCRNSKAWVANPFYALSVLEPPGPAAPAAPAAPAPARTAKAAEAQRAQGGRAEPEAVTVHAFLAHTGSPNPASASAGRQQAAVPPASPAGGAAPAPAGVPAQPKPQAQAQAQELAFEGIGFSVLQDVVLGRAGQGPAGQEPGLGLAAAGTVSSGFYTAEEVGAQLSLLPGVQYLLVPMTYRKGVHAPFRLQLFSSARLALRRLSPAEQAQLAHGTYREYSAQLVQICWARYLIRKHLRQRDHTRAHQLALSWFAKPYRNSDEGYKDLNAALNALEAAFIQLTGEPDAHGRFFPHMRQRLEGRGIKVADYDMCLPGPQND